MSKRCDNWPIEQDRVLLEHWPKGTPTTAILAMLEKVGPARTSQTVRNRVGVLRVRRPPGFMRNLIRSLSRGKEESLGELPANCRREERNGESILVCPPAYAYGAYRADQLWGGWVYGNRSRKGTT